MPTNPWLSQAYQNTSNPNQDYESYLSGLGIDVDPSKVGLLGYTSDLQSAQRGMESSFRDVATGLLGRDSEGISDSDGGPAAYTGDNEQDPPENQYGTDYDSCIALGKSDFMCTQMWET